MYSTVQYSTVLYRPDTVIKATHLSHLIALCLISDHQQCGLLMCFLPAQAPAIKPAISPFVMVSVCLTGQQGLVLARDSPGR